MPEIQPAKSARRLIWLVAAVCLLVPAAVTGQAVVGAGDFSAYIACISDPDNVEAPCPAGRDCSSRSPETSQREAAQPACDAAENDCNADPTCANILNQMAVSIGTLDTRPQWGSCCANNLCNAWTIACTPANVDGMPVDQMVVCPSFAEHQAAQGACDAALAQCTWDDPTCASTRGRFDSEGDGPLDTRPPWADCCANALCATWTDACALVDVTNTVVACTPAASPELEPDLAPPTPPANTYYSAGGCGYLYQEFSTDMNTDWTADGAGTCTTDASREACAANALCNATWDLIMGIPGQCKVEIQAIWADATARTMLFRFVRAGFYRSLW
eukprot:SAG11_NODE_1561_length_4677_cov_2.447138_4_plen_331_part_00